MQHNISTSHVTENDLTRLERNPSKYIKPLIYRLSYVYIALICIYNLFQPLDMMTAYAFSHLLLGLALLLAMHYARQEQPILHVFFVVAFIALVLSNGGIA